MRQSFLTLWISNVFFVETQAGDCCERTFTGQKITLLVPAIIFHWLSHCKKMNVTIESAFGSAFISGVMPFVSKANSFDELSLFWFEGVVSMHTKTNTRFAWFQIGHVLTLKAKAYFKPREIIAKLR